MGRSGGVTADGVNVDREIRGPEVTAAVSAVAAVPAVRELLVARQRQLVLELLALRVVWQFTVIQKITCFEKIAVFCQLLNGIAPIKQDAFLAIDECDRAFGGRGVGKGWVVAHQAKVIGADFDLAQVDGADGALLDGDLVRLARAVVGDGAVEDREGAEVGDSARARPVAVHLGRAPPADRDPVEDDIASHLHHPLAQRWRARHPGLDPHRVARISIHHPARGGGVQPAGHAAAARGRGEAMDHVLFFGPPGLGKTTLAQIVARELGVGFRATSGPVIVKAGDLAALLTNLEERDVLFIDEIHRLNPAVEEILYPAAKEAFQGYLTNAPTGDKAAEVQAMLKQLP